MALLFVLLALLALLTNTSARKLLQEKCEPMREHLGVFGRELMLELEADPESADLADLFNMEEWVDGADRKTFFIPQGKKAEETLRALRRGELGPLATPPTGPQYRRELQQIIYNHITGREHKKLGYRSLPTMAWDSSLVPVKEGRQLFYESSQTGRKAKVTAKNKFETCVGTVHIVDDVLVPHNILCSLPFDQCGGEGWTGSTCCVNHGSTEFHCATSPGSSIHAADQSYKQCIPVGFSRELEYQPASNTEEKCVQGTCNFNSPKSQDTNTYTSSPGYSFLMSRRGTRHRILNQAFDWQDEN